MSLKILVTNEIMVLKQIPIESNQRVNDQLTEVKLMSNLNHTNIVMYSNCFIKDQNICILQEFCDKGDMTQYIALQMGMPIRENKIRKFITEILLALDYIHNLKIIHRDLKPSNIFLKGKDYNIKIGDFGVRFIALIMVQISKLISVKCINHCNIGTLCYSSPEVVMNQEYDYKTDIWSLGCIIYQLCTNRIAFNSSNESALIDKICNGDIPLLPDIYSKELSSIYKICLQRDCKLRPSA